MIRESKNIGVSTQEDVLAYIGRLFRVSRMAAPDTSDAQIGRDLLEEVLFIHITEGSEEERNLQKFDLLCYMVRRVYFLTAGRTKPDNADALSNHELLLPGHLYYQIFKEQMEVWLGGIRSQISRDLRTRPEKVQLGEASYFTGVLDRLGDVPKRLTYFLKTGNLNSPSGLDLMQVGGFTIVAERLNYLRYLSHFRSVHRGQFFTTMKTTAVRKLLPESWGFMCPVHTPDGSPCGLLNHLAATCRILTHPETLNKPGLLSFLGQLGMIPATFQLPQPARYVPILLDGIVIGSVAPGQLDAMERELRLAKVLKAHHVPPTMELCCVRDLKDGTYPVLVLSTQSGRMVRPVLQLPSNKDQESRVEWVGPMEQVFLDIAVTAKEFVPGVPPSSSFSPLLPSLSLCSLSLSSSLLSRGDLTVVCLISVSSLSLSLLLGR
jgi:DNA-directed RNA polymerase I subunit RPA2